MAGIVYQISIGPKKQIGSTGEIERRMREHLIALENGRHYNRYMQNAYNKYGSFTYEILSTHGTREEAYIEEQVLIDKFYKKESYLMINPIATQPPIRVGSENPFSKEEVKRKILQVKKERNLFTRSESTKVKISLANKGRKQTREEIERRKAILVDVVKTEKYRKALVEGCKKAYSKKSTEAKLKSSQMFRENNPSYKLQVCSHCQKEIQGAGAFKRFHGDNCKLKNIINN